MAWQYHIILREQLALELDAWFEGLSISADESGRGIINGRFCDQAVLISLLQRLHELNFTLLAVTRSDFPLYTEHSKEHCD